MNNNSIEQLFQQFQDEFNVKPNGQVNSTIRGVARLCDVEHSTLVRALSTAIAQKPSGLVKFLLECGFEGGAQKQWLKDGIPDVAISYILEYYAYECQERYRKQQAKQFSRAFRAIGIRAWVQQQKGWQQEDEVDDTDNAYTKRIKYYSSQIEIPPDYWTIFHECSMLMGHLEKYFPIDRLDLVDGSVGKCWSNYRCEQAKEGAKWLRDRVPIT